MLKFGIVSIFPPARSALDKLRLAERLGFDTFWICDSHVIWNECYSLMGWLVAQSQSDHIQLGTMVTNPVSRDPIVIASAFATLQDLSGGRMLCGIGRGDSAVRVLKRRPATVVATELAANVIQTLGSGEPMEIDGVGVRVEWASGVRVPVYVAAYGPKMLQVAGRVGDGVIIECADPHYISWCLEHVRRGAEEAGRDPAQLAVICSTATYVAADLEFARDQVRPLGSVVGNHVAEVLRNNGPESMPPELAAFVENRPDYDYLHHVHKGVEHSKYVPDEIIDRLCLIGTTQQCAARLQELVQLGVTHVNFYAQTDDYDAQMEIYAREIIPQLRTQVAV
jgi:probable F420-dependent oxidoreductase